MGIIILGDFENYFLTTEFKYSEKLRLLNPEAVCLTRILFITSLVICAVYGIRRFNSAVTRVILWPL